MITIIRSAVGSLSSIGFLNFLKQHGFRIVGTDICADSVGKHFVDKFYLVPKAKEEAKVVACYKNIVKNEKAKWILSGPEEEISVLVKREAEFVKLGAKILHPPLKTLKIIEDKAKIYDYFLNKKGIDVPRTSCFDRAFCAKKTKIVLKLRKGRGSSKVFITESDKIPEFANILCRSEYIIQEFIPGQEFTVDAFFDLDGNILNIIPRKRIKVDSGISVVGQTVKDEQIIRLVSKISHYLKFRGGNCFQFIKNKQGKYYLIDINPRFGGGSILSLSASKTFRNNLLNLLIQKDRRLIKSSFDYKKMKMYRYYKEIYEI